MKPLAEAEAEPVAVDLWCGSVDGGKTERGRGTKTSVSLPASLRRLRRMELGVRFFFIVFATIVGFDRGRFIAAANYDESDLTASTANDVLLVTKPLVKMYEMGVMKEDEMSEVKPNQLKGGHFI